jgi:2-amino-4-hydroxy-6-hydroxymethyldihydropteridine diphosphokinase
MAVRAFLGLGSNLGDRLESLQRAVDLLAAAPGIRVVRSSRVYETDPMGGPPQPDFLNAVVEVETDLTPMELLRACHGIEDEMKRTRSVRWGPRTVDLDVLTYGSEQIDEDDLTVPHPRTHERAFVLVPLLELDPDPPLPGGRRVATLRLEPNALQGVRLYGHPLSISNGGRGSDP